MQTAIKWAGGPYPKRWLRKSDMDPHLRHEAKLIQFRFQQCWIAISPQGALMEDGQRMPVKEFWLTTPGHVIGAVDLQTASVESWSAEWRAAFSDWRLNQYPRSMAHAVNSVSS